MSKALLFTCNLLFALFVLTFSNASAQPNITSFSPLTAPVGSAVTISGTGFNATAAGNIVYFGAVRAAVTAAAASGVTVTVPAGATYQPVSVLNTATGLTGFSSRPFVTTFTNPFGTGLPPNFYNPETDIPVNNNPSQVAIGDIDGDGKPDLVMSTAASLAVWRNVSAKGTLSPSSFGSEIDFAAGANPTSVAIGDIDGDGRLDVAMTNGNAGSISVFRNVSSPGSITLSSFADRVDFATGGVPTFITIVDLDVDGKADLALVNSVSTDVSVMRNTSTPGSITASSFAPYADIPIGHNYRSIAFADLDGDKKPDLTVAGGFLSVLRNTSTPGALSASSFPARVDFAIGSGAQFVSAGDIDGDGRPDLVSSGNLYSNVSVLRNTAVSGSITLASFAAEEDFDVDAPSSFNAIADLNGDGRPDIVTSNYSSNSISVLSNTSAPGSITPSSLAPHVDFLASTFPGPLAIGDLDGDAIPEIAVVNTSEKNLSLFKTGTPPATLVPVITDLSPASGPVGTAVTISGFNFNPVAANNTVFFGAVKAAVISASATSLVVRVPAGATFQPVSVLNNASGLSAYAPLPFTLTFSNPYGNNIPPAFYQPKVDIAAGSLPYAIAFGDLDSDGKPDMIVVNQAANTISVLRNTSATGSITTASFAARIDFATGDDPRALAVGDIDGDGKLDIVVANAGASTVSVLRNVSVSGSITASSFAAKVDFPTGTAPFSVAIGDLNGDGKPELVIANQHSGTVSVMRNTATSGNFTAGSFATRTDFTTSNYPDASPRSVATGDLDGDGKPEIVVANEKTGNFSSSGTVAILHNNTAGGSIAAGSFSDRIENITGTGSNCIAIGDLNGDGKPDLAVSNYGSSTVSLFKNNFIPGVFDFTSFSYGYNAPTGPQPFFVAIADADGDGRPDLITANSGSSTVSLLRNIDSTGNSNGPDDVFTENNFQNVQHFATGGYPVYVAAGDLNGDGTAELATANAGNNTLSILNIVAPHVPVVASFSPASGPAGTVVTITGKNFNATPSSNTVYFGAVKANITAGSATSLTVTAPAGATYMPVSVLNNPAALTGYAASPFSLSFSNPFGTGVSANFYRPRVDFITGAQPFAIAFGDLDGDGKPDMIVANANAGTVSVLRNISATGTIAAGSFAARTDFATGANPRAVVVSDLDGDGKLDIAAACSASGMITILRNTSTPGSITAASFAARADFITGTYISSFAVGDLDSDGKPDIAFTNLYAGTVSVLRNTAGTGGLNATSFAPKVNYVGGDYPRSIAITDVNGDGKAELAVVNEHSNNVSVFWNQTLFGNIDSTSFNVRVDFPCGSNPSGVALCDADGDGRPDLVTVNYGSNTVSVLPNTTDAGDDISASSFAAKTDFATGLNPFFVAVGDVDGDGKPDLVTANSDPGTISVLRNTATLGSITAASFAVKADFGAGNYPVWITLGDLDGDGIAEVAAANAGGNTVSILKVSIPAATTASTTALVRAAAEPAALLQLFPNPTHGAFTLQLPAAGNGAMNLELINAGGTVIERRVLNNDIGKGSLTAVFNLHGQPAGVYYVKVTGVDGVRITKLILQR